MSTFIVFFHPLLTCIVNAFLCIFLILLQITVYVNAQKKHEIPFFFYNAAQHTDMNCLTGINVFSRYMRF